MPTQNHRINIAAEPDDVYRALSTVEGWSRWFTSDVQGEFVPDGEIVCELDDHPPIRLRVTSVEPGSAIAFESQEGPFAAPGATTSIRVTGADDGRTTVALQHQTPKIPDEDLAACNTYWGILFGQLRQYCQTHNAATVL